MRDDVVVGQAVWGGNQMSGYSVKYLVNLDNDVDTDTDT